MMGEETAPPKASRGGNGSPSLIRRVASYLIPWLRGPAPSLRESLEDVIEEHRDDTTALTPDERVMLMNIVTLREHSVSDVMVPRADIIAVSSVVSFEELVQTFKDAAHSRLPVYRDTLDDIIGMVHIKDVLAVIADAEKAATPPAVLDIKRPVLFVPPSMPVVDLLLKMRLSRIHMALVVDEYGGVDGLASIEDLIEEIVGEIEDEHDPHETPQITARSGNVLDVDARAPIEDLEARLSIDLLPEERDEVIDTVGGLVFSLAGRVPARGEIIRHPEGPEFEILDADSRRLKRLRVRVPKTLGTHGGG